MRFKAERNKSTTKCWNNWTRSTIKSGSLFQPLQCVSVCLRVYEVGLRVICLIAYNNNNNTLTSFNFFLLFSCSHSHSMSFKMVVADCCAAHIEPNLHSKHFGSGTFSMFVCYIICCRIVAAVPSLSRSSKLTANFFAPSFVDFSVVLFHLLLLLRYFSRIHSSIQWGIFFGLLSIDPRFILVRLLHRFPSSDRKNEKKKKYARCKECIEIIIIYKRHQLIWLQY